VKKLTEKFYGLFSLPGEFLQRLDRNFELVAQEERVYAVASAYTFQNSDTVTSLQVNATTAAITILLPASPTGSRRRTITKTDASGNAVTVNGNGVNINGAATYSLPAQWNSVTVEPTGTQWIVVANA
jgi:hypothetical protein